MIAAGVVTENICDDPEFECKKFVTVGKVLWKVGIGVAVFSCCCLGGKRVSQSLEQRQYDPSS